MSSDAEPDGEIDRRCSNCGKAIDDLPYELWMFHTCRSCAAEPAPGRWSAGMAPGTSVKWTYTPRWHLDSHPETGGTLVTDGGRDIGFDEPPETPDPPMYPEWEDVETWSKANLRYPVPGGWEITDHGKFHTTWEHDDGTKLTRSSKRTPGPKDTFSFSVDGEEIHSVDTGPQRVEMREETVWLLQFYDENDIESVEEFEVEVRKERNQSLDDFATDGGQVLPDSLKEFVDVAEEKDRLACDTCGELVKRRYLQDGECVGCRNGPGTHAPRYGVTDD